MPSTASEWLANIPGDVEGLEQVLIANGISIDILTEYPDWMKQEVANNLVETFSQPYWDDIHKTFLGDAEKYLQAGLSDGKSIVQMADDIAASFGGVGTAEYAKIRATAIARTESSNALNGARKTGMNRLTNDPQLMGTMRPVWLSVLGTTTRDSHANLDGVPADKNGMWNLSGYDIPWPGHISLPAGERLNCQCSIVLELGMQDLEATGLIGEYNTRVEEENKAFLDTKFNPHHDPRSGRFSSGTGSGAHLAPDTGGGTGGGGAGFAGYPSKKEAMKDALDNIDFSNLKGNDKKEFQGIAEDVIGRLNEESFNRGLDVRKIQFHATKESMDDAWFKATDEKLSALQGLGGFYDPYNRSLHSAGEYYKQISKGDLRNSRIDKFAHELTHSIDHGGEVKSKFSKSAAWKRVWKREIKGGYLSNYADTNSTEGFAEYGRALFGSSQRARIEAKKNMPGSYAFWKKNGLL